MKIKYHLLFLNRYLWIVFGLVTILPFLVWLISSEFLSALFIWDVSGLADTRWEYIQMMYSFFSYMVDGYSVMQLLAPILAAIVVIPFLNLKKVMVFFYPRIQSYQKWLIKNILLYLSVACLVMYVGYLIFMSVGALMLPADDVDRDLFSDIFGVGFAHYHPYLYYVLEGFLRYVVFMFVYGLFSISLSFLTDKNYLCVLIPAAYFIVLSVCVSVIQGIFITNQLSFLAPTYTLVPNDGFYVNTFVVLLPLIPVFAFSLAVLGYQLFFNKENDVYASD